MIQELQEDVQTATEITGEANEIVVYVDDFGTLSSGAVLEAERTAVGKFADAAEALAQGLLALVYIQDHDLWKQHYQYMADGTAGPQVYKNFWEGYVPWFVGAYGTAMNMQYSADWIRARIRMYRALEAQGYSMQEVLRVPLGVQYMLEKIVDLKELELKGQPGSETAAKELVNAVMHGEIDTGSLMQLTSGVNATFYYDGKTLSCVLSDGDGVIDVPIAVVQPNVPAAVLARFFSKLQVKSR